MTKMFVGVEDTGSSLGFNAMQRNATQCNAVQHNATQFDAMQRSLSCS